MIANNTPVARLLTRTRIRAVSIESPCVNREVTVKKKRRNRDEANLERSVVHCSGGPQVSLGRKSLTFLGHNARLLLVLLVGSSVLIFTNDTHSQTNITELDGMIKQQKYTEALEALNRSALSQVDRLSWLREKGEQGHIPLQYELSKALLQTSLTESLKWYARARLARTLDVAECRDASVSLLARMALDKISEDVVQAGQANPQLFNKAISDAIAWDANRASVPPSKWICGESKPPSTEGYVLPLEVRKKKRSEARLTMVSKAKLEEAKTLAIANGLRAKYQILDSKFPSYDDFLSSNAIYWLDNYRVVFLGYDVKRLATNGDEWLHKAVNGVFVWNVKNNHVTPLFEGRKVGNLCVFKSVISFYAVLEDSTKTVLEGTMEQFQGGRSERRVPDEKFNPNRSRWPNCSGISQLPVGIRSHSEIIFLLPEHGYIDLRRKEATPRAENYRLVRPAPGTVVPLSFPGLSPSIEVRYVEQRNAYMVTGSYFGPEMGQDEGNFPPLADRFFYWLAPNGHVSKEIQPFGYCTYTRGGGLVTRRGYLRHFCLASKDGEELIVSERARTAGGIAASPNGCLIAFGGAIGGQTREESQKERASGRIGNLTLNMIDICNGRR